MILEQLRYFLFAFIVILFFTTNVTAASDFIQEYENASCWFYEQDSDYQNFIFVYKDNVETTEQCCQFCNSNSKCMVWSLQKEIGRCYLKFERVARVYNRGFISGFSNNCNFYFFKKFLVVIFFKIL
jgi:hypothetical protein